MLLISVFFLPLALARTLPLQQRQTGCTTVHLILARGNNEPYPGRLGDLVTAVCRPYASCDYEDIVYDDPADKVYCHAVNDGASNGTAAITAYNARCPDSLLVLAGYSQGGQVVGDILGGGGGSFFGCTQNNNTGMDPTTAPGNKIVAAMTFGDIRHNGNQAYNVLSGADKDGDFPRPAEQLEGLNRWANTLRSYCVAEDPICARGENGTTHLTYFTTYGEDASAWVLGKVNDAQAAASAAAVAVAAAAATPETVQAASNDVAVQDVGDSVAAVSSAAPSSSAVPSSSAAAPVVSSSSSAVPVVVVPSSSAAPVVLSSSSEPSSTSTATGSSATFSPVDPEAITIAPIDEVLSDTFSIFGDWFEKLNDKIGDHVDETFDKISDAFEGLDDTFDLLSIASKQRKPRPGHGVSTESSEDDE